MKTRAARQILIAVVLLQLLGCQPKPESLGKQSDGQGKLGNGSAGAPLQANRQDVAILEAAGAKVVWSKDERAAEIDLRSIDVTDEMATAVSKLAALTKLSIDSSSMTNAGWAELGNLSLLQQLDLRDCSIDNKQLSSALVGMPKLRALRLSGKSGQTQVSDIGLKALANCSELKVLALDHLWIGKEGLAAMGQHPQLAELYLAGTLVDDEALELISAIPSLRKLRLAQNTVSATGIGKLASLALEDLDVSECSQLFDDAMEPIGKIHSLKRLNLWRDALTDEGVSHLKDLTNLEWLNLDNTQLSDTGLQHLEHMTKLNFLHLGSTSITDEGMPKLNNLKALKDLKVTRTAVTDLGVQKLSELIPGVSIQLKYVEGL